jgi:hypothetical protein
MISGRATATAGRPRPFRGTAWSLSELSGLIEPTRRNDMGRYALLWLLGVPIPILLLIWAFGGLH